MPRAFIAGLLVPLVLTAWGCQKASSLCSDSVIPELCESLSHCASITEAEEVMPEALKSASRPAERSDRDRVGHRGLRGSPCAASACVACRIPRALTVGSSCARNVCPRRRFLSHNIQPPHLSLRGVPTQWDGSTPTAPSVEVMGGWPCVRDRVTHLLLFPKQKRKVLP